MMRTLGAAAAGLVAAWCLALIFGFDPASAAEIVALAAGACLVVSLSGLALMTRLRGRPITVHLWVAALTTIFGAVAGVAIASWQMFISPEDAKTIIVILVAVGTVGVLTAVALATPMKQAVSILAHVATSLPQRTGNGIAIPKVPTRELSTFASQLQEVGDQLHESILRERSLEASRRELVAWISHDLRTPLAGIRAMAEALEDDLISDPETVAQYHQTMRAEVDRLSGMVDDLFRLSRIHAGLVNLHIETVSLADLVSDALALAAPIAKTKKVRLAGGVSDNGLRVRLSTTEFLRVLRNLLDNAVRHTHEGGEVLVHAEADTEEAILTVRDGCGGIPSRELGRVFEVGYRGELARTPGSGGRAGLGLAIAQGLVTAHGGSMFVNNERDGCCFTVRMPLPASA